MAKSKKLLRVFVDESGHSAPFEVSTHNEGERIYTVACIFIFQKEYEIFKKRLKKIKQKYSKQIGDKEIKSRSIRRSNPRGLDEKGREEAEYLFWKFENGQELYDAFCVDMKELVLRTKFKIVSVSVDKKKAQQKYPHLSIVGTAMRDLWERIFIAHFLGKVKNSCIFFDPVNDEIDRKVVDSYKIFKEVGTSYIHGERLKLVNMTKHIYPVESNKSVGIQLADYCAHPIRQRVTSGKESAFFSEIIKPKLHTNATDRKTKKVIYLGMKETLSR